MKKIKLLIILISLLVITPQSQAKEAQNSNTNLQYMNLQWWSKFNDQNLNNYLGEVYKNNQDLKIATINAKQSKEAIKQAFANQLPQLYFNGNIQRELHLQQQNLEML